MDRSEKSEKRSSKLLRGKKRERLEGSCSTLNLDRREFMLVSAAAATVVPAVANAEEEDSDRWPVVTVKNNDRLIQVNYKGEVWTLPAQVFGREAYFETPIVKRNRSGRPSEIRLIVSGAYTPGRRIGSQPDFYFRPQLIIKRYSGEYRIRARFDGLSSANKYYFRLNNNHPFAFARLTDWMSGKADISDGQVASFAVEFARRVFGDAVILRGSDNANQWPILTRFDNRGRFHVEARRGWWINLPDSHIIANELIFAVDPSDDQLASYECGFEALPLTIAGTNDRHGKGNRARRAHGYPATARILVCVDGEPLDPILIGDLAHKANDQTVDRLILQDSNTEQPTRVVMEVPFDPALDRTTWLRFGQPGTAGLYVDTCQGNSPQGSEPIENSEVVNTRSLQTSKQADDADVQATCVARGAMKSRSEPADDSATVERRRAIPVPASGRGNRRTDAPPCAVEGKTKPDALGMLTNPSLQGPLIGSTIDIKIINNNNRQIKYLQGVPERDPQELIQTTHGWPRHRARAIDVRLDPNTGENYDLNWEGGPLRIGMKSAARNTGKRYDIAISSENERITSFTGELPLVRFPAALTGADFSYLRLPYGEIQDFQLHLSGMLNRHKLVVSKPQPTGDQESNKTEGQPIDTLFPVPAEVSDANGPQPADLSFGSHSELSFGLDECKLEAARSRDLVALRFRFRNLYLNLSKEGLRIQSRPLKLPDDVPDEQDALQYPRQFELLDNEKKAALIVDLPPQHVAERVYFRTTLDGSLPTGQRGTVEGKPGKSPANLPEVSLPISAAGDFPREAENRLTFLRRLIRENEIEKCAQDPNYFLFTFFYHRFAKRQQNQQLSNTFKNYLNFKNTYFPGNTPDVGKIRAQIEIFHAAELSGLENDPNFAIADLLPRYQAAYLGRAVLLGLQDKAKREERLGHARKAAEQVDRLLYGHQVNGHSEEFAHVTQARLSGVSRLVFHVGPRLNQLRKGLPVQAHAIPFSLQGLTDWEPFDLIVVRRAERYERLANFFDVWSDDQDIAEIASSSASEVERTNAVEKLMTKRRQQFLAFQGIGPTDVTVESEQPWDARMQQVKAVYGTPIAAWETDIELPYRLSISPESGATFRAPQRAFLSQLTHIPLWKAELAESTVEEKRGLADVRAVASPDFAPGIFKARLDQSKTYPPTALAVEPWKDTDPRPFLSTISQNDRHQLVMLSSAYGLPSVPAVGDDARDVVADQYKAPGTPFNVDRISMAGHNEVQAVYDPQPLGVSELSLTMLGGNMRLDASFQPPAPVYTQTQPDSLFYAPSIQKYRHVIRLGRDIETELVYKGFLLPLGVQAALVKLTTREIHGRPGDTVPRAYLIQRMFIRIGNPEKRFPAVNQANAGRQWPVDLLTMITTQTPFIVSPLDPRQPDTTALGGQFGVTPTGRVMERDSDAWNDFPGLVFWPRIAPRDGAEVQFDFNINQSGEAVTMPLLFVDNTAAHDQDTVKKLVENYYRTGAVSDAKRTLDHRGVKRRYAQEDLAGDTTLKTFTWKVGVEGREVRNQTEAGNQSRYRMDTAAMETSNQPPFYPTLVDCKVTCQQVERFLGDNTPKVKASFDTNYINFGFDEDRNPRSMILKFADGEQVALAFSGDGLERGDRAGGIGQPNSETTAFSRKLGPTKPANSGVAEAPLGEANGGGDEKFDIGNMFDIDAKILGLVKFSDLFDLANVRLDDIPACQEIINYAVGAADEIDILLNELFEFVRSDDNDDDGLAGVQSLALIRQIYPTLDQGLNRIKAVLTTWKSERENLKDPAGSDTKRAAVSINAVGKLVEPITQLVNEISRLASNPIGPIKSYIERQFLSEFKDILTVVCADEATGNRLTDLACDANLFVTNWPLGTPEEQIERVKQVLRERLINLVLNTKMIDWLGVTTGLPLPANPQVRSRLETIIDKIAVALINGNSVNLEDFAHLFGHTIAPEIRQRMQAALSGFSGSVRQDAERYIAQLDAYINQMQVAFPRVRVLGAQDIRLTGDRNILANRTSLPITEFDLCWNAFVGRSIGAIAASLDRLKGARRPEVIAQELKALAQTLEQSLIIAGNESVSKLTRIAGAYADELWLSDDVREICQSAGSAMRALVDELAKGVGTGANYAEELRKRLQKTRKDLDQLTSQLQLEVVAKLEDVQQAASDTLDTFTPTDGSTISFAISKNYLRGLITPQLKELAEHINLAISNHIVFTPDSGQIVNLTSRIGRDLDEIQRRMGSVQDNDLCDLLVSGSTDNLKTFFAALTAVQSDTQTLGTQLFAAHKQLWQAPNNLWRDLASLEFEDETVNQFFAGLEAALRRDLASASQAIQDQFWAEYDNATASINPNDPPNRPLLTTPFFKGTIAREIASVRGEVASGIKEAIGLAVPLITTAHEATTLGSNLGAAFRQVSASNDPLAQSSAVRAALAAIRDVDAIANAKEETFARELQEGIDAAIREIDSLERLYKEVRTNVAFVRSGDQAQIRQGVENLIKMLPGGEGFVDSTGEKIQLLEDKLEHIERLAWQRVQPILQAGDALVDEALDVAVGLLVDVAETLYGIQSQVVTRRHDIVAEIGKELGEGNSQINESFLGLIAVFLSTLIPGDSSGNGDCAIQDPTITDTVARLFWVSDNGEDPPDRIYSCGEPNNFYLGDLLSEQVALLATVAGIGDGLPDWIEKMEDRETDQVEALKMVWAQISAGDGPATRTLIDTIFNRMEEIVNADLSQIVDLNVLKEELLDYLRRIIPGRIDVGYGMAFGLVSNPFIVPDDVDDADIKKIPKGQLQQLQPLVPYISLARDLSGNSDSLTDALVGGTSLVAFITDGKKKFYISAKASIDLIGGTKPEFRVLAVLKPFVLKLIGDFDVLKVAFHGAMFESVPGRDSSFQTRINTVVFGEELQFLAKLAALLSPGKSGPYITPVFLPLGIEVGYRINIGTVPFAGLILSNLFFTASCRLPFGEGEAQFGMALSSRESPFLMSMPPYGGGGFMRILADANNVTLMEASIEFGGVADFSFGPLTGIGRLTAGFYVRHGPNLTYLEGFFFAGGEAQIACFGIAASLYVGLAHSNGNMRGTARFTFSFSIGFLDFEFSVQVEYSRDGEGDGVGFLLTPWEMPTRFAFLNDPAYFRRHAGRRRNAYDDGQTQFAGAYENIRIADVIDDLKSCAKILRCSTPMTDLSYGADIGFRVTAAACKGEDWDEHSDYFDNKMILDAEEF